MLRVLQDKLAAWASSSMRCSPSSVLTGLLRAGDPILGARIRWTWFVAFSFLGGLGFSLPFYYWLDMHGRADNTSRAARRFDP